MKSIQSIKNIPLKSLHAIKLQKKEKEIVPPKNFNTLMQKIMMKKRGFLGSMKMMGKMILK